MEILEARHVRVQPLIIWENQPRSE
jgi:hypothetical protein